MAEARTLAHVALLGWRDAECNGRGELFRRVRVERREKASMTRDTAPIAPVSLENVAHERNLIVEHPPTMLRCNEPRQDGSKEPQCGAPNHANT